MQATPATEDARNASDTGGSRLGRRQRSLEGEDVSRNIRAATVYVRPDRFRLAQFVALVNAGDLTVEVTRRIPLAELHALHAEAETGRIVGKVVVP